LILTVYSETYFCHRGAPLICVQGGEYFLVMSRQFSEMDSHRESETAIAIMLSLLKYNSMSISRY
jgi:hypothetical protein